MTRRVEITEEIVKDGQIVYTLGDTITADKNKANNWVKWGWATCCATGEKHNRVPGAQAVESDNISQEIS